MTETTSHIGRKISRIRELRGIKQETLAFELGISQQSISKIEQTESLGDETLEKVAKILGVLPNAIKKFSDEAALDYFNTFNDSEANKNYSDEAVLNYFNTFNDNSTGAFNNFNCTFNPLDKVIELYERLLESEREKVELLKQTKN